MNTVIVRRFSDLTRKEVRKLILLTNYRYNKPGIMHPWLKGNYRGILAYTPWAGWAGFRLSQSSYIPTIVSCFVAPEFRNQGIGRLLVECLLRLHMPVSIRHCNKTREWWRKIFSYNGYWISEHHCNVVYNRLYEEGRAEL